MIICIYIYVYIYLYLYPIPIIIPPVRFPSFRRRHTTASCPFSAARCSGGRSAPRCRFARLEKRWAAVAVGGR